MMLNMLQDVLYESTTRLGNGLQGVSMRDRPGQKSIAKVAAG